MPKHLFDLASAGAGNGGAVPPMNRAPSGSQGHGLYHVNATDTSADVMIYGAIGGWDGIAAEDLVPEIATLGVDTINVRMNSPGGSVFDGLAIYNALATHDAHVIVHIEGLSASIASIIAMAGDEIRIGESANLMIHKPWSIALGDADAFRSEADILDKLQDGLLAVYVARSGRDAADVSAKINAETWFRGQEAVDFGLADTVVPNKAGKGKKNALVMPMLNAFKNTPQELLDAAASDPAVRKFENLLNNLRDAGDFDSVSKNDAKRLAGLAARCFGPQRDVEPPAPCDGDASRDAEQVAATAAFLRSFK